MVTAVFRNDAQGIRILQRLQFSAAIELSGLV